MKVVGVFIYSICLQATYGKYVVAVVNESQTDHYAIKTLAVRKDVQVICFEI